jgi:hypothetical protein
MTPSDALRPGHLLRDFPLPDGRMLSDFRGYANVLFLYGDAAALQPLLLALEGRGQELAENETRILVVLRAGELPELPFRIFHDADGAIAARLAKQNDGAAPRYLAAMTDRFGEMFFTANASAGEPLPSADEVVKWAGYVAAYCPECHPPEWPPV